MFARHFPAEILKFLSESLKKKLNSRENYSYGLDQRVMLASFAVFQAIEEIFLEVVIPGRRPVSFVAQHSSAI